MRVYTSNASGEAEIRKMRDFNVGRLVCMDGFRRPVPGVPWALDNGAFGAWRRGDPFPEDGLWSCFLNADCDGYGRLYLESHGISWPDFAVCPDIVAGGLDSLRFSLAWMDRLPSFFPWYLAVQDGMSEWDVAEAWDLAPELSGTPFRGVFVGGTLEWKMRTAESWVRFAHDRDVPCHIGRVGTVNRLVWARRIGADSVDSTNFARSNAYDRVEIAQRQQVLQVTA